MQPDIAAVDGPPCAVCESPAVVHWQRRLTDDEIAAEQAKEQARRDQADLLANPQLPPTVWPPLPDCADYTRVIYACMTHAISGKDDAGARIHQAGCTAPNSADLPGCNCTPESLPEPDPEPEQAPLPPGW